MISSSLILIPNRSFLVRFGSTHVLGEFGGAIVSMSRLNEPDMPPKRTIRSFPYSNSAK